MEAEYGFPIIPLSTYETKLRNVLGLRKKLKKADWTAIHQHYQDRGGKKTGIYLNGSKIPWEKAWKEIRRSGARSVTRGQDIALPPGVVIRTPSPAGPTAFTPPLVHESQSYGNYLPSSGVPSQELCARPFNQIIAQSPQNMAQQPQGYQSPSISGNILLENINVAGFLELASVKYNIALSDIPWNTFQDKMLSAGYPTLKIDIGIHETWKTAFSSVTFPLLHQGTASSLPALEFDVYYLLAKAIYLISNKMVKGEYSYNDKCPDIFKILLDRVPKPVLIGLFQFDLPTIKATWESLVYCAGTFAYRDNFSFLINVGIQHIGWVVPRGASYLGFAASMGALNVVRSLLKAGARADGEIGMYEQSPLVEAAATGDLECVKLLLEKCDTNRVIKHGLRCGEKTTLTLFVETLESTSFFTPLRQDYAYQEVSSVSNKGGLRIHLNPKNKQQARGLTMLLESGGKIDGKISMERTIFRNWRLHELYKLKKIPVEWHPTLLEISYYQNAKVFHELLPYSTRRMEHATRSDIWLSAEQGQKVLDEYLMSRPSDPSFDTMEFLELVLAEQFFRDSRSIDAKVIQGLVEFGVDLKRAAFPKNINYFLCRLVCIVQSLDDDDFTVILKLLLCSDAVVNEDVLEASIVNEGIDTLLVLSQHGADIAKYGGKALSRAARFDNYKAASWLLDAGVDINAAVYRDTFQGFRPNTVIALATKRRYLRIWEGSFSSRSPSYEMLEYLIEHGAELKSSPDDRSSFTFLNHFLRSAEEDLRIDGKAFVDKVKLFLDLKLNHYDLVGPGCLLESCFPLHFGMTEVEIEQRLAVFELLLERGAPVLNSRVLPSLIYYGGRRETVQKLLGDGMDINVYSGSGDGEIESTYTPIQAAALQSDNALVVELVMMGADINKPAAGFFGRTALQAACELKPATTERREKKMKLIQFLIERGAEINAPAAPNYGRTALQCAAFIGDMEAALLLLYHGAAVNALPATERGGFCALDGAAYWGRLDMVKLFLNVGALSHHRGHTGYEGAIREAEEQRHFVIADLIREHAASNEKLYGVNLAMTF